MGPLCSNIFKCQYCLKFNANIGCCDLPSKVPECNYDDGSDRSCTGPGLFPVPKQPTKYYECNKINQDYKLTVKTCDNNQEFNSETGRCGESQKKQPICKYEGFVGDSYECNKYIYCTKRTNDTFAEYEFSCPPGEIFFGRYNNCEFMDEKDLCDCKINSQIIG